MLLLVLSEGGFQSKGPIAVVTGKPFRFVMENYVILKILLEKKLLLAIVTRQGGKVGMSILEVVSYN